MRKSVKSVRVWKIKEVKEKVIWTTKNRDQQTRIVFILVKYINM